MKTVSNGGDIRRVDNAEAEKLVERGWKYISKGKWKEEVRDKGKAKKVVVEKKVEVVEKKSQYKKV
jgi:hypothetical protein